jgi:hypothetical protein
MVPGVIRIGAGIHACCGLHSFAASRLTTPFRSLIPHGLA